MSNSAEFRPAPDRRERLSSDNFLARLTESLSARSQASNAARRPVTAFPELDCVRHRLPVAALAAAERRAQEVGVTGDRVLVTSGLLDEETYVRALAHSLGMAFEPLDMLPRGACPIDDERLVEANAVGLLPFVAGDELELVIAPRGVATRRLGALLRGSSELRRRVRLTTDERLRRFVEHHAGTAVGKRAAFGLLGAWPDLSAAPRRFGAPQWGMVGAAAAVLGGAIAAPGLAVTGLGVVLSAVFLAWTALRLFGVLTAVPPPPVLPRRPADTLPVFTVIIALYREAGAVEGLVRALDALDWPPEKLDIKFMLERDDGQTRAALEAMRLGRPYEVRIVPDIGPRTKPKALNAALPFARGAFVTVFDAEDRPEPDQFRRAFEALAGHDDRLACVQARLTIDNTKDNWLTGIFTAEYAGLFDVLLPGLATHRLPLPLGGSSNYFRTAVLREAGGWDPHNLTEDADLGMRLARLGYRSAVIASTTYEEAPAKLGAWLRQRRRWFQGWLQTWFVHMRSPLRLLRELGPAGFITFQLVVGGTVLAALAHPLFAIGFLLELAIAGPRHGDGVAGMILAHLSGVTFVSGYLTTVLLGLVGLARRRLLSSAWVLLWVPVHWLLLSVAAWQAVYKLIRDPYRWDKTEHGRARTSRMAKDSQASPAAGRRQGRIVGDDIRISSEATRAA